MIKPIELILLPEAEEFVEKMNISSKKKLFYAIRKTKSGLIGDWFKKLKNSYNIFEFRIKDNNFYIRLFAFWDNTGDIDTLVVCTHGLIKKTNKTPRQDIEKANKIKRDYFKGLKQ